MEEMSRKHAGPSATAVEEVEDMRNRVVEERLAPQAVFDSDRFRASRRAPWRAESADPWTTVPVTRGSARFADALQRASDVMDSRPAERAEGEALALRSVAHLAAAAAHEINNPLTVIFGGLELLSQNATLDEHSQRWVSRALDAARDIHETVRQMGLIKRLETVTEPAPLPVMLDIERSSQDAGEPAASRADLAWRVRAAYLSGS
jgi:signal transduction histidine kinase